MKTTVTEDVTSRVITFKLEDADPLLHRPYGWAERKDRFFQPDRAVIKIQDKQRLSIELFGPQILKGGQLSENTRLKARWSRREMDARHTAAPPAWVLEIWNQAGGR